MIDLYTSRRDKFIKCEWWTQDIIIRDFENNKIVYENVPSGTFYAKEVNSYSTQNQIVAEAYLLEENNITIETSDNVEKLRVNDLVRYAKNIYRVDSIQKKYIVKNKQFIPNEKCSAMYYISLRR